MYEVHVWMLMWNVWFSKMLYWVQFMYTMYNTIISIYTKSDNADDHFNIVMYYI